VDYWIGQTLCAVLLAAPMSLYISSHVTDPTNAHHKNHSLMLPNESTFEEIRALGFQSGVPSYMNWQILRRILLSPRFYVRKLVNGLHDAFCTGTIGERAYNASIWFVILTIAHTANQLIVLIVTYSIPRLLYDGAQVLRVLIEHTYDEPDCPRTLSSYRRMTSAIILADPVPSIAENASHLEVILHWSEWSLKMLVHLWARVFIATGDTVNHYTHHVRPGASFINHEIERMKLVREGHIIHSNWGLVAAIESFFISLSKQSPDLFTRIRE
jgi:hypothetical protein